MGCRFQTRHPAVTSDRRRVSLFWAPTTLERPIWLVPWGLAANRNYYEVKYIRLPDILVEITVARGSGAYCKLRRKYKSVSLLILDEWLLYSFNESEARYLRILKEARNKESSTNFCSQLDVNEWRVSLYDPTTTAAICDRIIYNAHTVKTEGDFTEKRRQ